MTALGREMGLKEMTGFSKPRSDLFAAKIPGSTAV
jgi:hypothetical protein